MRRTFARLAAACALAATFTGTAIAGGNPNAPGQQKKDDAATQQPAAQQQQASQPAAQQTAPGQAKQGDASPAPDQQWTEPAAQQPQQVTAKHESHGQSKKSQSSSSSHAASTQAAATQAVSTGAAASTQAGVKPSSTTTKWTHCRTGGSAGAATCTAQEGTPNVGADVSKRYGNGKTAAQIAVSRGAPAGTLITGPGNSQPHKVSDCRHKSNKSGGVDVHAIKSYSASCATQTQQVPVTPAVTVTHVCGQDIVTTKTLSVAGVLHGKHEHLMTNTHSAHFTKHADKVGYSVSESTQVVPTSETCGSSNSSNSSSSSSNTSTSTSSNTSSSTSSNTSTSNTSSSTSSNTSTGVSSNVSNTSSNVTSNTSSNTSPATQSTSAAPVGGVLGAQATIAKPKAKSSGGVLGTVSNVAGSSLPFTGFPIWIAALIGLGLVASGVVFWRRGAARI